MATASAATRLAFAGALAAAGVSPTVARVLLRHGQTFMRLARSEPGEPTATTGATCGGCNTGISAPVRGHPGRCALCVAEARIASLAEAARLKPGLGPDGVTLTLTTPAGDVIAVPYLPQSTAVARSTRP